MDSQLSFKFEREITNQDILQYEPLIHKMINKYLNKGNIPDYSVDREDALQHGRMILFNALKNYNSNRGASEMTFVYMCLETKFITFREKIMRKAGRFIPTEEFPTLGYDTEIINNARLDINTLTSGMKKRDKKHALERILLGKTITEVKNNRKVSVKKIKDASAEAKRRLMNVI